MKYKVYFEIYGKKLCATVDARSEQEAKDKVLGRLVFHKVVLQEEYFEEESIFSNAELERLKKIFGI